MAEGIEKLIPDDLSTIDEQVKQIEIDFPERIGYLGTPIELIFAAKALCPDATLEDFAYLLPLEG